MFPSQNGKERTDTRPTGTGHTGACTQKSVYDGDGDRRCSEVLATRIPEKMPALAARIRDHRTRAVLLGDSDDIAAVHMELARLAPASKLPRTLLARFDNARDFQAGLAARLSVAAGTEHQFIPEDFVHLTADIKRTWDRLAGIFHKQAAFGLTLRYFPPSAEKNGWHVDPLANGAVRAVRSLSPLGTQIGLSRESGRDIHEEFIRLGRKPADYIDGGQSLCLLKKGTVHRTPQTGQGRWIYILDIS